jgi:TetR/AcrR family transcriptional regulator, transcriptional repressor for nem operon
MQTSNTRSAILEAAQEMVQRQGINAMCYQDIGEAVGICKASVFHHFPTKDCKNDCWNSLYSVDKAEKR